MPHFTFQLGDDDRVLQVLKDGQPHRQSVSLEQAYSIVTIYFQTAASYLAQMPTIENRNNRRAVGLQLFLMSLTGLEAFTNTYFHQRARELGSEAMIARIAQSHGSLSRKIEDLVAMTPDGPLVDQATLIQRIFELSRLRNEIVHPRWDPSALTIGGPVLIHIDGLVENRQADFEDLDLCREALLWCLLTLARIGQARGHTDLRSFLFYWTGNFGLGLDRLLEQLGLNDRAS